MTISLQVAVPDSFLSSSSNYYSFKMQAGCYSCKNLTLEMDLTNTLSTSVQLVPAPLLVDYIRINTGLGAIPQTLYSKELWGYLAMSSDNVKMTGNQYITNISHHLPVRRLYSSWGLSHLQHPTVALLPRAAGLLPWNWA